jgi:hypothetical protein
LFHIIGFEVAILSHEDTVDATGACRANSPPLLGAKHALSNQILQEELLLVHLRCVSERQMQDEIFVRDRERLDATTFRILTRIDPATEDC